MNKLTLAAVLIVFLAIRCQAGLFDKLNSAINTALPVANTNPPTQEPVANPPIQNSQVANPNAAEVKSVEPSKDEGTVKAAQPSAAVAAPQTNSVVQSEQNANSSPQKVKAFKTLNFGDDAKTVKSKLIEIVGGPVGLETDGPSKFSETVWGSLFDTEAEYESSKTMPDKKLIISRPDEQSKTLEQYLKDTIGVEVISSKNSAVSVNCYQLGQWLNKKGDDELAIVEVSYITFDLDKLIAGFTQNYPNVQKENRTYKFESETFPGIFLEFERAYLSDVNPDRRAKLSIPTGKFNFVFTDPSKLSKDQLAIWQAAMAADGKTSQLNEYYESVKASILGLAGKMESAKKLDDYSLTILGFSHGTGSNSAYYESVIYGAPTAIFASKQILGLHMNNYRQSIESKDQAEKAKLKKESESSTGF